MNYGEIFNYLTEHNSFKCKIVLQNFFSTFYCKYMRVWKLISNNARTFFMQSTFYTSYLLNFYSFSYKSSKYILFKCDCSIKKKQLIKVLYYNESFIQIWNIYRLSSRLFINLYWMNDIFLEFVCEKSQKKSSKCNAACGSPFFLYNRSCGKFELAIYTAEYNT